MPALKAVAADAAGKGHDIKIVVLTGPSQFTYYRDIALTVQQQTGGTVIVLGPDSLGSAGPEFPGSSRSPRRRISHCPIRRVRHDKWSIS